MTSEMMALITTESIVMRDRKLVADKIAELKKDNPWYPTQSLNGKIGGYDRKLRTIRAKKKELVLKGL